MSYPASLATDSADDTHPLTQLRIEHGHGSWWLADDGAPNGAYVERNGQVVPVRGRAPLVDGDVVRIRVTAAKAGNFVCGELTFHDSASGTHQDSPSNRENEYVCLDYDLVEGRLYCVTPAGRTELVKPRPQQRRLVAYMAGRNRASGCSAVLCTYEELRQAIWGDEDGEQPHTEQEINRLVWELRRAIGAIFKQAAPFETVRGVGYRLHTPLRAASPAVCAERN